MNGKLDIGLVQEVITDDLFPLHSLGQESEIVRLISGGAGNLYLLALHNPSSRVDYRNALQDSK